MWYDSRMSRAPAATDFSSFTITTSAGTLFSFADDGMPSSVPAGTKSFKGRIESGKFRARLDGSAASTTIGELYESGEDILFSESMISQASLCATTGTSVLQGHFYNVESDVFLGGS